MTGWFFALAGYETRRGARNDSWGVVVGKTFVFQKFDSKREALKAHLDRVLHEKKTLPMDAKPAVALPASSSSSSSSSASAEIGRAHV